MAEKFAFKKTQLVKPTFGTPAYPYPVTLEEEVTAAVYEWYESRGLPVPLEDIAACRGIDAAQQEEFKKEAAAAEAVKPKPLYGTPEFWKDWWARKKAKEAELKAAGLPIPEPKPRKKSPKAPKAG